MDDNIYREGGDKEIKNMQKTSQNNRTAIDKSTDLVYNTGMRNKNTLTKENEMKKTSQQMGQDAKEATRVIWERRQARWATWKKAKKNPNRA